MRIRYLSRIVWNLNTDSNVPILCLRYVSYKDSMRCNAHGECALNDAMHMFMLPFHFRNLTCVAKIKTWELICRNQDKVAFFQKNRYGTQVVYIRRFFFKFRNVVLKIDRYNSIRLNCIRRIGYYYIGISTKSRVYNTTKIHSRYTCMRNVKLRICWHEVFYHGITRIFSLVASFTWRNRKSGYI